MPSPTSRLSMMPAAFFGIVLGLAGLANAWRAAHRLWGLPAAIGETLFALAALVWLVLTLLYAAKWITAPALAREEAAHPVQCCFLGLIGVATMLVALGALPYARPVAILLFGLGAAFTLGFALWRTGLLWRGERDAAATTPVLYLPMVAGSFVTATAAALLGWPEWGQLAFGAGLFSWLAIESVLLHRLYTGAMLPAPLRPTLGIQLAPPAVGAVAYLAVGGGSDLIAHALIGYALLQALLFLRMAGWITEQPFAPSYWAFTFGATALAGASERVALAAPDGALALLAPILFAGANLLVLVIAVRTLHLAALGRLLPPLPALVAPAPGQLDKQGPAAI